MPRKLFDGAVATTTQEALDFIGNMLESSTEYSIIGKDLEGKILLWNEGARRIYGYEPEEVVGKMHCSILHIPEDVRAGKPRAIMDCALRTGKWQGTLERVRKNRQRFPARMVVTPRRDPCGRPVGFLLISSDISEELRLSAALENAEGDFHRLLEAAPDAMVIVDQQGAIVMANDQTEKLFGYSREELYQKPVEVLIPKRFRGSHHGHRERYFGDPRVRPMGAGLELFGLRQDGTEFPIEIMLSPLHTKQGLCVSSAIRDITERKRFQQTLQEKNVELERANLAKDRFLASMSHELRTPLNAIIGFAGTLMMKLAGPLNEEQERQLRTIQSSSKHLLSLINDLLDLAKIESGKVELSFEPVDCHKLLEEVAGTLRPLAEEKGLRFEVSAPRKELLIDTDWRALRQILLNLVNNAIKFTEAGSVRVEVRERPTNGLKGTEFAVIDTGVGIRPEDQERLFQAFSQLDVHITRQREGTGIGLHLSQKLAQLLGGQISVESQYGKGSTFRLIVGVAEKTAKAYASAHSRC